MAEYIDKQSLIGEIAENLKSILVVTELEKVTPVILETLSYYEVSRVAQREDSVKTSADILKMFLDAKCVEGRTGKTLERYEYILNHFFEHENVSACEVTSYHIRDYFMKEKTRGISDATIGGYRYILSSFYGWLFNEGLIGKNPCHNVGTIKQEKKVRKAFSQVEIQRMLDADTLSNFEEFEERKKGKNIATDYDEVDQFVCSECGIELQNWVRVERDEDDGDVTYHEYRFNFCPNCGADIRGQT